MSIGTWVDKAVTEAVAGVTATAMFATVLSAPIILAGQAVRWLQSGVWPELSILNSWWWAFEQDLLINISWKGANTVINGVLQWPLALMVPLFFSAIFIAVLALEGD